MPIVRDDTWLPRLLVEDDVPRISLASVEEGVLSGAGYTVAVLPTADDVLRNRPVPVPVPVPVDSVVSSALNAEMLDFRPPDIDPLERDWDDGGMAVLRLEDDVHARLDVWLAPALE